MGQNSDLTVLVGNTTLNVRVVILLETPDGYIFERSSEGYLFALGGRIQTNESSMDAAVRELEEEIGVTGVELSLAGLVENFYTASNGMRMHEINFIYRSKIAEVIDISELQSEQEQNVGYVCHKQEEFAQLDIKPQALIQVCKSTDSFCHIVNREQ